MQGWPLGTKRCQGCQTAGLSNRRAAKAAGRQVGQPAGRQAPGRRPTCSQMMPGRSRWLVGSSSSSRSGCRNKACASDTRMRQPPAPGGRRRASTPAAARAGSYTPRPPAAAQQHQAVSWPVATEPPLQRRCPRIPDSCPSGASCCACVNPRPVSMARACACASSGSRRDSRSNRSFSRSCVRGRGWGVVQQRPLHRGMMCK